MAVLPPPVTDMWTTVCTVTALVGIWNVPVVEPAGIVMAVCRKIMNDGLSLDTWRVASALGADATVTVPCTTELKPEVTFGVIVKDTGLGDGVTVRSTLQELNLPFEVEEAQQVSADVLTQLPAAEFPHVAEVITEIMQSGRTENFEFGLDLILDGLERILDRAEGSSNLKGNDTTS